jgi:hypothetical protein
MATSTSPTAGSGIANPNQATLNDYYQEGHQAPSGPWRGGSAMTVVTPPFCKLDGLKAIQGKGCSGGGNRLLQVTVYSLVIFFIAKKMFPKQAMGVMVGSLVLGVFSALLVTRAQEIRNRKVKSWLS